MSRVGSFIYTITRGGPKSSGTWTLNVESLLGQNPLKTLDLPKKQDLPKHDLPKNGISMIREPKYHRITAKPAKRLADNDVQMVLRSLRPKQQIDCHFVVNGH
jgi:hypothetical protein